MQFLITALGSYGDVHPMVGLGVALAERGHGVKIVANPYFADVVEGAGLVLVPVSTRETYLEVSRDPDIWHPVRGGKLVLKWVASKLLCELYEQVVANYEPGETVFCAHVLDVASRTAAEKLAAPIAAVDFAPAMFWSLYDGPRLPQTMLGPRVPRWLKRFQYWCADTLFALPIIGRELNKLRRELGLGPVRRFFGEWLHDTDLVLAMFPEWFAAPQPDWPANTRLVGFPLWDGGMEAALDVKLEEFLADSGGPPIVFSPGSANHHAQQFFRVAVEACEQLGRRGLLLTKYAHQLPTKLPAGIMHGGFVPLGKVLPRAAALVHHGGIGTSAQGLAGGVPHVVRPMAHDQFDNSQRLARLGVAEEISVRHFSGPRLADSLTRLLNSPEVAARCRKYAARCDGPAALAAACDALERLAESRLAR